MTASNLNKLLDDEITVADFNASMTDEFENHARLMQKKGSIIDLRFYEDEAIHIDCPRFKKLLDFVVQNQLSNIHLAYICECLTLSENLTTDEKTKSLIFQLADLEINGGYVDKKTLSILVSELS